MIMKSSNTNLYLFQFSFIYGGQIYLPYSVGMLWAYARTMTKIDQNIENKGFVIVREHPNDIVARLENPRIAVFSTYIWNFELSASVARLIKQHYPDCLVVFGGPQVPNPDRLGTFFEQYPCIDIAVHGEGEVTFSELLLAYIDGTDFQKVPGLTYRGFTTESRPRTPDLNIFPSPYLTGEFDPLFALPYQFNAVWETNRGCPYRCTFCDWGSLTAQKIFQFDENRLAKEMEYFAQKKISHIYMADANFGILPRDVGIAYRMAEIKRNNGGYPQKVRVNYAKNDAERVYEIANLLNKEKMDKGITLSVQSLDPTTLTTIKRTNLKYETLSSFIKKYQTAGIDTHTEVIMGLAGETWTSFKNGIESLLEASAHDSLWIYRCEILPNAPMNDSSYRKKHGIKTIRTPMFLNHAAPGEDPVQEYEDIVIETATLPPGDFIKCLHLSWAIQTFHALGLLQVVAIYVKKIHGTPYTRFYECLMEYAERHSNTLLGKEYLHTKDKIEACLTKQATWDNIVPEYSELSWELEEASFLRFMSSVRTFYSELGEFLDYLQNSEGITLDREVLPDLLRYQEAMIVKVEHSGTTEFQVGCSIHSFHRHELTGQEGNLARGTYNISIVDPYDYSGDKSRYATEVVFWGRRGGKTLYQECQETPIPTTLVESVSGGR